MTKSDEIPVGIMERIGRGIELQQQGERAAARTLFAGLWNEIGETGDALHRCALAHWMADVQDDLRAELTWDLRALDAAGSIEAFYPSLHLNLGEVYRKLGDLHAARHHLDLGLAAARALGDDGYSNMIKGGLNHLAERLSTA